MTTVAVSPQWATVSRSGIPDGVPVESGEGGEPVGDDLPELHFVRPLPGFPELDKFVLVRLGDDVDGVLFELRSLADPQMRFLVGMPTAFFPDYVVELDEAACSDLGLDSESDALLLVVLTVGTEGAPTTANLLAPVVINARTRSAAQVILSGTDWPVRAAIV